MSTPIASINPVKHHSWLPPKEDTTKWWSYYGPDILNISSNRVPSRFRWVYHLVLCKSSFVGVVMRCWLWRNRGAAQEPKFGDCIVCNKTSPTSMPSVTLLGCRSAQKSLSLNGSCGSVAPNTLPSVRDRRVRDRPARLVLASLPIR